MTPPTLASPPPQDPPASPHTLTSVSMTSPTRKEVTDTPRMRTSLRFFLRNTRGYMSTSAVTRLSTHTNWTRGRGVGGQARHHPPTEKLRQPALAHRSRRQPCLPPDSPECPLHGWGWIHPPKLPLVPGRASPPDMRPAPSCFKGLQGITFNVGEQARCFPPTTHAHHCLSGSEWPSLLIPGCPVPGGRP